MMLFTAITITGVEVNPGTKIKDAVSPKVQLDNCRYCGKNHDRGNCPAFGKECSKCSRKNHFKAVFKSGSKCDQSRSKKGSKKGKKFHEINESESDY